MSKTVLANGFQAVLLKSDSIEENLTYFRETVKTFQPDFFFVQMYLQWIFPPHGAELVSMN